MLLFVEPVRALYAAVYARVKIQLLLLTESLARAAPVVAASATLIAALVNPLCVAFVPMVTTVA